MKLFWVLVGILTIGFAFVGDRLMKRLGLRNRSQLFTVPHFQRSARTIEKASQVLLLALGLAFLSEGVAHLFLSNQAILILNTILIGVAGITLLIMIAVTIRNWRA